MFAGEDRDGRPVRSHVVREPHPEQAAVVLRIFEMYDSGLGTKAIAKRLTAERAPSPSPTEGWWSPTTVRDLLARPLYRGVVVWNRSRKRNSWGEQKQGPRPLEDRVTVVNEDLRIIPRTCGCGWRLAAPRLKEKRCDSPTAACRADHRDMP